MAFLYLVRVRSATSTSLLFLLMTSFRTSVITTPDISIIANIHGKIVAIECSGTDMFYCDPEHCVPRSWRCNNRIDCPEARDEIGCASNCTNEQFRCHAPEKDGTHKCITRMWVCDGEAECSDGSDEVNCASYICPDMFQCKVGGPCIDFSKQCDREEDCIDMSDEKNCNFTCNNNEFLCANGECLSFNWKCDGDPDCMDGGDELNCTSNCTNEQFRCHAPEKDGTHKCITRMWVCDGEAECSDGSDEVNCASYICPDMFQCKVGGPCIDFSKQCDREEDCIDMSDEKNCNFTCNNNEFLCANGECLSFNWKCDGDPDCMDGGDELNCTCSGANIFNCSDGTCINKDRKCDNTADCADGTDEIGCETPKSCADDHIACAISNDCIHSDYVCDGQNDCPSGSDERMCNHNNCTGNTFLCKTPISHNSSYISYHCIDHSKRCDGFNDCLDNTDEFEADGEPCKRIKGTCLPDVEFDCTGHGNQCVAMELMCNGKFECDNKQDEMNDKCSNDTINSCLANNGYCQQLCVWKYREQKCACYPGYQLYDDTNCEDVNECEEVGRCSQKCENTPHQNFTCSCYEGYHVDTLNTHLCIADGDPAYLLLAHKIDIRKYNLRTKEYTLVANSTVSAISLDFDFEASNVFWSNLKLSKIIQQSMVNDKESEVVLQNGMESSDGLAYDWIHKNLYWTDTGLNKIGVMSTENNEDFNHRILFNYNLDEPRAIVVDPRDLQGWFYWTDWGKKPSIERASLDGSNRTIILQGNMIKWANGLTIDFVSNHLFWCDAKLKSIQRINFDGSGLKLILHSNHMLPHPFSITVFEDTLYWTDWNSDAIHSASKFNGSNTRVVQKVHTPMGIVVYHKLRQPSAKNRCGDDNQGCSDLCLPSAYFKTSHGVVAPTFKCLCTTGRSIGVDYKTCSQDVKTLCTKIPKIDENSKSHNYRVLYTLLILTFVLSSIALIGLVSRKIYLRQQGKPLNFENLVYRKTTNKISIETDGFHAISDRIPLTSESIIAQTDGVYYPNT